ncbi:MAG: DUF5610 domain-containing protein [Fibrobacter sp.]|nr:DUF5610 domain-containing protein [Fibrobacter sp.]
MAIQGMTLPASSPFTINTPYNGYLKSSRDSKNQVNPAVEQSRAVAEYYSAEKYAMEYVSKDGDKVSFSMESINYQKASLEIGPDMSPEQVDKLIAFAKEQIQKMREELVSQILESVNGKEDKNDVKKVKETPEIEVPEYWNAENTSQRIVDFATSFFDAFQGAGADFLDTIKGAIEKGFEEAFEILGPLPEAVSELTGSTYDLVMQKLDNWAVEKGIITPEGDVNAEAAL